MAKGTTSKPSKAASKSEMKSQIKVSRVASTKVGPIPTGGGGWRLAGNHNETLLR